MSTTHISHRPDADRLLELVGVALLVVALLVAGVGIGVAVLGSGTVTITPAVGSMVVFGLLTVLVALSVARHRRHA